VDNNADGTLKIVSARWGIGTQWADVTERVRLLVHDGRFSEVVPPEAGGLGFPDPAPNQYKDLEVVYTHKGSTKKVRLKAGQRMELP
jgi:hypothetical protein